MSCCSRQGGFTLLEILISVSIFALVSTATFSMLQQTIKASDIFDDKAAYLVELQRAKRLLQQDLTQVVPRSIRDEFGEVLPAVMSEDVNWGVAIELTRAGRSNPLEKDRSNLLRLRYFFDGEKLIRRTWKRLDRAPEAEYLDQVVIDNVKTWQVRFFNDNNWLDSFPTDIDESVTNLPSAIEVTLSLTDDREFRWLFSVFPKIQVQ